ncbi:nucleotide exchange factor GrpE [Candidatus Laterigemmans baculatus]|uniref:nucleotide exchange factor GrpE n=1 Tax=Candidatus Laterigemmans baculatus TaxID=2770505 RepID=UPI0013D99A98|nr:nucleotide exchange factor GrpE [Candidatus Laterigemmans baculatus]
MNHNSQRNHAGDDPQQSESTDQPQAAQPQQAAGQGAPQQAGEAAGQSAQDPAAAEQTPEQQIESLQVDLEEANRRLLMAQADVENFRKRMRRDYEEQIRYAAVPLIRDMLEVRDNLQRAFDSAQSGEQSSEQSAGLREGVAIVAKQFDEVLGKHHCRPIPAEGELFDPNYHEAISQMPSDAHPAGTVMHEATRGYQLHERVVRPSQVIVSTGPAE